MKIGDLDRMLVSEGSITPSPGFAQSVMRGIRAVHDHVPVVPFPWRGLVAGLAASIVLAAVTVGVLAIGRAEGEFAFDSTVVMQRLRGIEFFWFMATAVAAVLTLLATRLSLDYMTE